MPITVLNPDEEMRRVNLEISECQKWIINNYQDLQTKYPDEHIAVHNKQVIDHDKDIQILLKRLGAQYWDFRHISIRFISKEKVALVI